MAWYREVDQVLLLFKIYALTILPRFTSIIIKIIRIIQQAIYVLLLLLPFAALKAQETSTGINGGITDTAKHAIPQAVITSYVRHSLRAQVHNNNRPQWALRYSRHRGRRALFRRRRTVAGITQMQERADHPNTAGRAFATLNFTLAAADQAAYHSYHFRQKQTQSKQLWNRIKYRKGPDRFHSNYQPQPYRYHQIGAPEL